MGDLVRRIEYATEETERVVKKPFRETHALIAGLRANHQTVVTERTATYVVSATTNRRDQIIRASELDRCNHVSDARASRDYPRNVD